jgi:Leucine-rich repeat (LRR) protein
MGALLSLNISNNNIVSDTPDIKVANDYSAGDLVEYEGVQCPVTFACSSYYRVRACHGIIALASAIKDMRALTSLHVGKNNIPDIKMREIIAITMRMESMKILCEVPFKDKTLTELDISGKNLGMEGALVVAEYLDGNDAITSLNLSDNDIWPGGAKHIATAIKVTNC